MKGTIYMTYPSLINIGIPQQQKISAEVFEDTRLSSLIDNDAVAVMQKPCSGEDISERQRLFLSIGLADGPGTIACIQA